MCPAGGVFCSLMNGDFAINCQHLDPIERKCWVIKARKSSTEQVYCISVYFGSNSNFVFTGGTRGGLDQFKWDDVKTDKDRENYLGHSVLAPVGRWQKGRDLNWYAKGKTHDEAIEEEKQRIREMDEDLINASLGIKSTRKKVYNTSLDNVEVKQYLSRGDIERADHDAERVQGLGAAPVKLHDHIEQSSFMDKEIQRFKEGKPLTEEAASQLAGYLTEKGGLISKFPQSSSHSSDFQAGNNMTDNISTDAVAAATSNVVITKESEKSARKAAHKAEKQQLKKDKKEKKEEKKKHKKSKSDDQHEASNSSSNDVQRNEDSSKYSKEVRNREEVAVRDRSRSRDRSLNRNSAVRNREEDGIRDRPRSRSRDRRAVNRDSRDRSDYKPAQQTQEYESRDQRRDRSNDRSYDRGGDRSYERGRDDRGRDNRDGFRNL